MIVVVLIALGLILGSFVNAFAWRLHEHKDWVNDRSECPHCHHKLGALDLIPVASWVWLRGKCRYCHHKIPDSPLTELAMPTLFLVSYAWWPQPLHGAGLFAFVLWLVFLVGFVTLALYDFRWFTLPNKLVFPLIGLAVIQAGVLFAVYRTGWQDLAGAAVGAAMVSGLFYALFQISKGTWIGGGDVKLAMALGLLAGGPLQSALLLFVASLAGTLFALPQLLTGKATRKAHVPFGPFLIFGLLIVKLFGAGMVAWYSSLVAL
jgi:prepilin signal peptidase PulO-like enzyme (type II secretory pathway)